MRPRVLQAEFPFSTSETFAEIKSFICASFLRLCKHNVKSMAEWEELDFEKTVAQRMLKEAALLRSLEVESKKVNVQFWT